ncbi:MAG: hypothetical protein C4567_06015 [Deltaproteobacteria bacterium]|nr:MAG: hypothetical protein C4567_06015 [Deltaproteobacteria bacterium]
MRQITAILILAVAVLLAQTAAAENLLVNGAFETGDFSGWNYQSASRASLEVSREKPYEGQWAVKITGFGKCTISQTFATIPGQLYQVNFRRAGGGLYNRLSVYWAGTKIYQEDEFDDPNYQSDSSVHLATGPSTTLEFVYDGVNNSFYLDDIGVCRNLLVNPGFETGNLSGWNHQGSALSVKKNKPHSGQWSADFWLSHGSGGQCQLSQTFPTVPGQSYEVSFWRSGGDNYQNSLRFYWDGIKIYEKNAFMSDNYVFVFPSPMVASGTSATLKIVYGLGSGSSLYLDDIQVNPVQNLVVNGNFETGDFSGWSIQKDYINLWVSNWEPFDGKWSAQGGRQTGDEPSCKLSQTFATTPGKSYRVVFWRMGGAENNTNFLQAYWNGAAIHSYNSLGDSTVWHYSVVSSTQVASGASTTLEFIFAPGQSNLFFYLDNVQVNPIAAPITAPRPGKARPEIEMLLLE